MIALKWIVVTLALLQGGWLLFDGIRALTFGDYVTPNSGPHAGQLGPWAKVVAAVGLEPRSTAVKAAHLGLGIAWMVSLISFALAASAGWLMLLLCAVASLWYLPLGTILSAVLIGALVLLRSWTA